MLNPLRARRKALQLTQAQLAAAAGVSRQLVVAAETGVNTPSVDAALRLAAVLDCDPADLFGTLRGQGDGRSTAIAPTAAPPMPASRAQIAPARVVRGALVVAGCDPALQIAETMLRDAGPTQIVALDATTAAALRSLRQGGAHAAVVHGPPGHLPAAPVDVLRIQLAHWRVGLGVATSSEVASLEECLVRGVQIVQRGSGASSQRALERAARTLGKKPVPGAVVTSHLDAARAACALGCAAITTESAALALGLRFLALETHTVELWVDSRQRDHPGVEALGNLLSARVFTGRVRRLGGYDLAGCGAVLSEPGGMYNNALNRSFAHSGSVNDTATRQQSHAAGRQHAG